MKAWQAFLTAGLAMSILSKLLQFRLKKAELGNFLVIPAAVCLVLALLWAMPRFTAAYGDPALRNTALLFAAVACGGVVSFQLMAMSLVHKRIAIGLICAVPFLALAAWAVNLGLRILR